MADYSGATAGNITIQDGDTIGATGNLVVSVGDIATVEAGASVQQYYGTYVYIAGTLTCVGTEENPIWIYPQAADPVVNNAFEGFRNSGNDAVITVKFTKISGADYPFYLDGNNLTLDIQTVWLDKCDVLHLSGLQNFDNVVKKIYMVSLNSITRDTNHSSYTFRSDWNWVEGCSFFLDIDEANGTLEFKNNIVMNTGSVATVEDTSTPYFEQLYVGNKSGALFSREVDTVVTLTDSVAYRAASMAIIGYAGATITSTHNDMIGCSSAALIGTNGTVTSDYDYVAGCAGKPDYVVDQTYDTQVTALTSRTNELATPVHPLEVDNISEGTPDQDSVTITFDCKAGTAGSKRLYGLPFIKYGTVSGAYDMQSKLPPSEEWGLYWINWKTDMTWKQTGHSVTLDNLKPGTTYYYKCCFVDPFGRLGESVEGDFTTESAGGGGEHSYGCI